MRRIGILAIVGLLVSLPVFGLAQSPSPLQPPATQNSQQQAKPEERGTEQKPVFVEIREPKKSQDEIDRENKRESEKLISDQRLVDLTADLAYYTRLLFIATAVLAAITAGLVFFGFIQTIDVKESTKAATESVKLAREEFIASHRPRLRARNVVIDPPVFAPGNVVKGHYFISNYGDGPARVIETYSMVFWTDAPLPMERPYEQELGVHGDDTWINSGGARRYAFQSTGVISKQDSDVIKSGNGRWIYVMGWVEYADKAETRRRTAFCQRYVALERRFCPVADIDYENEE